MNARNIMEEISNPKNWKKTHKKQYSVYMCRPSIGTQCQNKFEGVSYVTDQNKQFILSGTAGEVWAVDGGKLASTYMFVDGTPINANTLAQKSLVEGEMDWTKLITRPDAGINWAFFLPKSIQNFPVKTSWGDVLYANRYGVGHLKGDFLICSDMGGRPNLQDMWVVNGAIFPRTYDLHAFPNMYGPEITQAETPKPIVRFNKKSPINSPADKHIRLLADGLKRLGHTIGKINNVSVIEKSFKLDNGKFGIKVKYDKGSGTAIGLYTHIKSRFVELVEFFGEDMGDDIQESIKILHAIMRKSGSDLIDVSYKFASIAGATVLVPVIVPKGDIYDIRPVYFKQKLAVMKKLFERKGFKFTIDYFDPKDQGRCVASNGGPLDLFIELYFNNDLIEVNVADAEGNVEETGLKIKVYASTKEYAELVERAVKFQVNNKF